MDERISEILRSKTSADLIVLFGSTAKGTTRNDSDIDIAFLSDQVISEYELFVISQELADILKREVDLIDLYKASTVLRAQILGTGRIIYSTDKKKKDEFYIKAFKEYCLLNEERQVILDKIRERGSIYA